MCDGEILQADGKTYYLNMFDPDNDLDGDGYANLTSFTPLDIPAAIKARFNDTCPFVSFSPPRLSHVLD